MFVCLSTTDSHVLLCNPPRAFARWPARRFFYITGDKWSIGIASSDGGGIERKFNVPVKAKDEQASHARKEFYTIVLSEIDSTLSPLHADQAERLTCFVGSGTDFSGEIAFSGIMHLDGTFSGLIASDDGTLMVGVSGEIDASIQVAVAQIHGMVKGDISAKEHVVLKPTAIIMGDIETPSLRIEDGAVFEGRCRMSGGPSAAQAVRRKLRKLGQQR